MTEHLFDDRRITAMGLFTEAFTGLTARVSGQLATHGLSLVEFEVLIRLARSPRSQLRMTDLAAQTQLTTSGITRVVDRLERTGLVRREACPTDRRSSFAVLTDAGRTRMEEVLPGHLELIEHWFTGRLMPDQLSQLLDSLRVVRDAVRPEATSGAARNASECETR
ncbi:MarR family transcriptional regulator [Planosporangium thailandense]|uniref:MarR family transcriptional regulator n=2 Tax=Planosporangium thailandense TaxID=765197 RepID=A0ABX0XS06_9ACTN|nr:MarR family transcriptional regulator [Planosporangium thailandense]